MINTATLAKATREAAQKNLGKDFVKDVQVSDYVDSTGEKAFEILVVVDSFDPNRLSSTVRWEIVRSLIQTLADAGDDRHPFIKFVPQDELADLVANDD